MQVATDILKLLFFPGLLFMASCGYLLLFLEGRLRSVFYGGAAPRLYVPAAGGVRKDVNTPGDLAAAAFSLAAMGVAGIMLVGIKGDLFTLVLLLSAVEIVPLFAAAAGGGGEALFVPLIFKAGLFRMAALICVAVSVSLRFPATFSPGLESLRGESTFNAVQLWSGPDFGLILASLVCAVLAFSVVLLGRPACGERLKPGEAGAIQGSMLIAGEGAQRAVSLLLFAVLFLGYPWEGWRGLLLWSGSALGTAALMTVSRAWLEGRDRLLLRRLQAAATFLALLSLALAVAAVA
ncbi:MAG: hypothetical protein JW854_05445 [Actinobacteria bacterium]|nr:hypothetical protein [Actinomycetota bacterium]